MKQLGDAAGGTHYQRNSEKNIGGSVEKVEDNASDLRTQRLKPGRSVRPPAPPCPPLSSPPWFGQKPRRPLLHDSHDALAGRRPPESSLASLQAASSWARRTRELKSEFCLRLCRRMTPGGALAVFSIRSATHWVAGAARARAAPCRVVPGATLGPLTRGRRVG
jgi:hypothetical protein